MTTILYIKLISFTEHTTKALKISHLSLLNYHTYRTIAGKPGKYGDSNVQDAIDI